MTPVKSSDGFTLVELMAAVAIVSILTVVALSTYSDYAIRAKVSEGLVFAAEAKTSVAEYYYSTRRMPDDNEASGLPAAHSYDQYQQISRLEITTIGTKGGVIEIEFKMATLGLDNILHLIPGTRGQVVTWACKPAEENGIERTRVPPVCRT